MESSSDRRYRDELNPLLQDMSAWSRSASQGRGGAPQYDLHDKQFLQSVALVGGGPLALHRYHFCRYVETRVKFNMRASKLCAELSHDHPSLGGLADLLHAFSRRRSLASEIKDSDSMHFVVAVLPALMASALTRGVPGLAAACLYLRKHAKLSPIELDADRAHRPRHLAHDASTADAQRADVLSPTPRAATDSDGAGPASYGALAMRPSLLEAPVREVAPQERAPSAALSAPLPQPSAVALGKRRAFTEMSPSPRPTQRPRIGVIVPAAVAAKTSFTWLRAGRAISSDLSLFTALTFGGHAGAAAARFSAWVGKLWIEQADLAVFAALTDPSASTLEQDKPSPLSMGGWEMICSAKQAFALLASQTPSSDQVLLKMHLQGLQVEASQAILRALVRQHGDDADVQFTGTLNGRELHCGLSLLSKLIGPNAETLLADDARVSVTFSGKALSAPAKIVRRLLRAPSAL